MGYNKQDKISKEKLFEELSRISKEHGVTFWTAQQPQRKFSGYQIEVRLAPHTGETRYIGFFPMDHSDLI